jgi:predicted lipoprotein with Yx(FWY)xxD motif
MIAAAALALSACGSTSYSSNTTTTTKAPGVGPGTSTLGSTTIAGLGTVLTGTGGKTLYHLTTETSSSLQCTTGCTSTWIPYTVASGTTPTRASGVVGLISTVQRPDGSTQVTFDGHPVYFFVGDTAVGQDLGQGAGGTWFVLHPTASATAHAPVSTTTQGGGY